MRRYISALLSPVRQRIIGKRTYRIPARIPLDLAYPTVIREFLPSSAIDSLKAFAEEAYAENARRETRWAQRPEVAETYRWGGLNLVHLAERHAESLEQVIAPVRKAIYQKWEGAVFLPAFSSFRRVWRENPEHRGTYIFWHIDADGAGSHTHDPVWNCWWPLEDVGTDYPSVEVVRDSEAYMRKQPLRIGPGPYGNANRSDNGWFEQHFPDAQPWCPHLKRGDAFCFSHWTIHRTQPLEQLKGPRIGLEARFTIR